MRSAETETIPLTECAKLIRKHLKGKFPKTKFSVRSKSYSGGCSIDVCWTDGPNGAAVDAVLGHYEGAEFDGMTDSTNYKDSALMAKDGSVKFVHYGVNYVHGSRSISNFDEKEVACTSYIMANCTLDKTDKEGIPYAKVGNQYVSDLARKMVHTMQDGETVELAFRRIVFREEV